MSVTVRSIDEYFFCASAFCSLSILLTPTSSAETSSRCTFNFIRSPLATTSLERHQRTLESPTKFATAVPSAKNELKLLRRADGNSDLTGTYTARHERQPSPLNVLVRPRSLIVRITCVVLLAATLAMGIIDTLDSCSTAAFSVLSVFNLTDIYSGSFYQADFFGLSASGLSLATNMVATILIGCKAWEHSKIMATVASLSRSSQVEKILIFLVESGTIYCIIWVSILTYQVALLGSDVVSVPEKKVFSTFDYFAKGCLIPLIGMYPTTIITLVALNKSHFYGTSFQGGPVSDISFRNPVAITSSGIEGPSLPTVASCVHTSRIEHGCGTGVEHQVDELSSPDSGRSSHCGR